MLHKLHKIPSFCVSGWFAVCMVWMWEGEKEEGDSGDIIGVKRLMEDIPTLMYSQRISLLKLFISGRRMTSKNVIIFLSVLVLPRASEPRTHASTYTLSQFKNESLPFSDDQGHWADTLNSISTWKGICWTRHVIIGAQPASVLGLCTISAITHFC